MKEFQLQRPTHMEDFHSEITHLFEGDLGFDLDDCAVVKAIYWAPYDEAIDPAHAFSAFCRTAL